MKSIIRSISAADSRREKPGIGPYPSAIRRRMAARSPRRIISEARRSAAGFCRRALGVPSPRAPWQRAQ